MNFTKKYCVVVTGLFSALVMSFSAGCASGGYKITREYAGFVNRQNIILRIVLYIFTFVVFAVTMLIDLVIFNTMDFWNGRVAQGTYKFEKDNHIFVAEHSLSDTNLRRSKILILNKDEKVLQTVLLQETAQAEIEVYVDGQLKNKVSDIQSVPQLTTYNSTGKAVGLRPLFEQQLASH